MNAKQKAKELTDKILKAHGSKKLYPTDRTTAILMVNEIIDALKTTTGHCELRRLDRQEVQSDFDYWNKVKVEIESLP
jgi:hypothetical protein